MQRALARGQTRSWGTLLPGLNRIIRLRDRQCAPLCQNSIPFAQISAQIRLKNSILAQIIVENQDFPRLLFAKSAPHGCKTEGFAQISAQMPIKNRKVAHIDILRKAPEGKAI